MSETNYLPPSYEKCFFDPVEALRDKENKPTDSLLEKAGDGVANRVYAVHTLGTNAVGAASLGKACKEWTLVAVHQVPLLGRAVPETHTARGAWGATKRTLSHLIAAAVSPIVGLLNPFWTIGLHERLGLVSQQVFQKQMVISNPLSKKPAPPSLYGSRPPAPTSIRFTKPSAPILEKHHDVKALHRVRQDLVVELKKELHIKTKEENRALLIAANRVFNRLHEQGGSLTAARSAVLSEYAHVRQMNGFTQTLLAPSVTPLKAIEGMDEETATKLAELIHEEVGDALRPQPFGSHVTRPVDEMKHLEAMVKASANRLALTQLQKRLQEKVGDEMTNIIMGNWELLGDDVRNNQLLISDAMIEKVVGYAGEMREFCQEASIDPAEFFREFILAKAQIKRGEMPANTDLLNRFFPALKGVLESPKADRFKKELTDVMRAQLLMKVKKEPAKFTPTPVELKFYRHFGLDPKRLGEDPHQVHAKLLPTIEALFSKKELSSSSIEQLKEALRIVGLREKLKIMDGNPQFAGVIADEAKRGKKVRPMLMDCCDLVNEKVTDKVNDVPEFQGNPKLAAQVKRPLVLTPARLHRSLLETMLSQAQLANTPIELRKMLNEAWRHMEVDATTVAESHLAKVDKAITRERKIFDQFPGLIAYPFAQGFDDEQDVFLEGVCWAMVLRLSVLEQRHPEMTAEKLARHLVITPSDRYNQASYSVDPFRKQFMDGEIKNPHFHRQGLNKIGVREISSLDDFKGKASVYLENNQPQLKAKHGVTKFSLVGKDWGHAIYMRTDRERGVYHFVDPNYGLTKEFGSEQEIVAALDAFLKVKYPDTKLIAFTQQELRDDQTAAAA